MHYNDFSMRLRKTLKSLNGRFNDEIAVYVLDQQTENEILFSIQAGKEDEDEIINKIFIILYNLSSLKDNLKNCLETKNVNPKIVEDRINESLHLQVLIDLVNQEKHGYPLTKSNRSNKNPLIKHPMQMINFTSSSEPGSVAGISYDGKQVNTFGTPTDMEIMALIFDDKNNFLFMLDELVNKCYEIFVSIAQEHNCC